MTFSRMSTIVVSGPVLTMLPFQPMGPFFPRPPKLNVHVPAFSLTPLPVETPPRLSKLHQAHLPLAGSMPPIISNDASVLFAVNFRNDLLRIHSQWSSRALPLASLLIQTPPPAVARSPQVRKACSALLASFDLS